MQEIEEIENIEEFRDEEIVKKSKFKGGLSGM